MKLDQNNKESVFDLPSSAPQGAESMPLDNPEAAGQEPVGELPQRAELPPPAPPAQPTLPAPADPSASVDEPDAGAGHTPVAADDADLIEKEWVDKAKAIVEQSREDPRRQTAELSKIKADYIKKRFNKDVPV